MRTNEEQGRNDMDGAGAGLGGLSRQEPTPQACAAASTPAAGRSNARIALHSPLFCVLLFLLLSLCVATGMDKESIVAVEQRTKKCGCGRSKPRPNGREAVVRGRAPASRPAIMTQSRAFGSLVAPCCGPGLQQQLRTVQIRRATRKRPGRKQRLQRAAI